MKKKIVLLTLAAVLALSATACGSGDSGTEPKDGGGETTSEVANADKPLIWFNRQPSNSSTGELDTTALNFNDNTYYVGFDANQGAELQGTMVMDYIEANIDTIDRNGDGIIDENDRYAVGNGNTPPWVFGMQFGFDWKGLDLSLLLQGTAGLKVLWMDRFNMGYLTHGSAINKEIAEGAWRDGRTDATFPRLLTRTNAINNQPSDFWVEDKSYMRLKNIQIGYTLPSKWMQKIDVSRLRIYISGENLFTLTGYRGIDPEVSGTTYPNLRQYMVGINLSF